MKLTYNFWFLCVFAGWPLAIIKNTGWIFNSAVFERVTNCFWIKVKPKFLAETNSVHQNISLFWTDNNFWRKIMSKLYNLHFVEFWCWAKYRPFFHGAVFINWSFIEKNIVQSLYLVMEGVNMIKTMLFIKEWVMTIEILVKSAYLMKN